LKPTRWTYVPLVVGAVLMLFPLWWMLVVSLETPAKAGAAVVDAGALSWFPEDPQWSNYPDALREVGSEPWQGFLDALANSIVITLLSVIGTVLSCSLVAYAFARIRFRGSRPLFLAMLATMMLPPQVTMIPLFLLFRSLGWVDTILPLVVPAFFGNAFFVFMFRQFFAQVPEALVEAARLDGCGHLEIWWRIIPEPVRRARGCQLPDGGQPRDDVALHPALLPRTEAVRGRPAEGSRQRLMAKVTLEGLSKTYPGGITAVQGVDLDVEHGEFVVLVGPSGCGKSTTLRMIAGLEEISGGSLEIGGRVVNEVAGRDRNVAMVFQNYALYPHLTVQKNLAFGLERRRKHPSRIKRLCASAYRAAARAEDAEIRRRVTDAAKTLGIGDLLERLPGALSGGQRQRVAVGRALVREPDVFLFDEPLSNLDAKLRVEMRAELSALHAATGATMVYVTHDQEEAMTLGDRLVVMQDGAVQQIASPREVYDRPANRFVAGFVGTPTMNFLTADFEGSPRAGQGLVMGIRPDRLSFAESTGPLSQACRILRIEDLGDRADVHMQLGGGERWVARIAREDAAGLEAGTSQVTFAANHTHWFEPGADGRRIG